MIEANENRISKGGMTTLTAFVKSDAESEVYDGEVAWSYYSNSAGNWVGVDHGDGIYTVYMHMSKRLVSEGDKVKKGDVLGLVGTTGRSTGNHLHFAVRQNGSYVDPLKWVSP